MDVNDNPWEVPLDDEYWEALLRQAEVPSETVPPVDEEEVLRRFGAEYTFDPTKEEGDPMSLEPFPSEAAEGIESLASEIDWLEQDWQFCFQCFEADETLDLEVTGYNRGGLLVKLNRLQGFVPASQLIDLPQGMGAMERRTELANRVGERLKLKILEVDRDQNRLILSERMTTSERGQAEEIWDKLKEGTIYRGIVSNIRPFGAFVDLGGGVEGLIHISEISWRRVDHPSDVLHVRDEIDVYVISVDRERKRVALSLKRLRPDPWSSVEERYKVGQLVEGTITNVVSFGAFARIEDGLEGLIHISELAEGNFLHPRNVVKEGDVVTVRILNIDSGRHRLGLSLRRAWNAGQKPSTPAEQRPYL